MTEAIHYFVGHCCYSPNCEERYLAVSAAHIIHMLRDTFQDIRSGYYNIPIKVLEEEHITPQGVHTQAYRDWVHSRAQLARQYFRAGKVYIDQLESGRCRLAGQSYIARFESVLDTIEKDGYQLREQYNEGSGIRTIWLTGRFLM